MSTQNDLLDGSDSNLERLSNEVPEQSDMCLNWQDDVDNNFPNCEPDAVGDNNIARTCNKKENIIWIIMIKFLSNISFNILICMHATACRWELE